MDGITNSGDMSLSKLWEMVKDRKPDMPPSTSSQRARHNLATEEMLLTARLPRSEYLLILWLQSSSAVILEPREIKSVTVSIAFPSICHEVRGSDAMIFVF